MLVLAGTYRGREYGAAGGVIACEERVFPELDEPAEQHRGALLGRFVEAGR